MVTVSSNGIAWMANGGTANAPGDSGMPNHSPELIQTMRAALDAVMTKIPADQVRPGIKAHLAEVILKAAAEGQTSYEALVASASDQIHPIISMLT